MWIQFVICPINSNFVIPSFSFKQVFDRFLKSLCFLLVVVFLMSGSLINLLSTQIKVLNIPKNILQEVFDSCFCYII